VGQSRPTAFARVQSVTQFLRPCSETSFSAPCVGPVLDVVMNNHTACENFVWNAAGIIAY
jgi:hypothetical protein